MSSSATPTAALTVEWDPELIHRYDNAGPRYTSYPTALEFHEGFEDDDLEEAIEEGRGRPLSLYVHIPFCHTLCWYCGCNKVVTRQLDIVDDYLDTLEQEVITRGAQFAGREVVQLHFGGGTPSFLSLDQRRRVLAFLHKAFQFAPDAEISIEVDPRRIEPTLIDELHEEGFNRLSIGVQDFNSEVQKAIHREQDDELIFGLRERARALGFRSFSIDLIYGLPLQTAERFAYTLERTLALAPDRISLFSYAHLPDHFPSQRLIHTEDMPKAEEKLELLQMAIARLTEGGFDFIGMDHFARPDDELAAAQRNGHLHRNFQGYTPRGDTDVLGLGVSAISSFHTAYAQNVKDVASYQDTVNTLGHALWRGVMLTPDDIMRRDIINTLMCQFRLDIPAIEQRYGIDFCRDMADDMALMAPLAADGLVDVSRDAITITPRGRLLVRTVAACFDVYLRRDKHQHYSKVI
ncbi:oxygen-independent coproporphyrinogen III oxidase [Zymobacter sp. IVIA_12111.31 C1]|uniref:oxygen-independent coproporphyrinogen III oxidase n=1 Tax=Zymobacter sp. IVIA_12111.31 C1 TaxID=3394854 RepID=UPI0039C2A2E3